MRCLWPPTLSRGLLQACRLNSGNGLCQGANCKEEKKTACVYAGAQRQTFKSNLPWAGFPNIIQTPETKVLTTWQKAAWNNITRISWWKSTVNIVYKGVFPLKPSTHLGKQMVKTKAKESWEMAQRVEVPASTPDNLSWGPGAHGGETDDWLPQSWSPPSAYTMVGAFTPTLTHTHVCTH